MSDGLSVKERRISTLEKEISPPPPSNTPKPQSASLSQSLSALEAGKETSADPLTTISAGLVEHTPDPALARQPELKTIPFDAWKDLYTRNAHKNGHHFVIHQHDHPIAGPHYDLRLQISESSSVSWSVMYGLPGDPNSRRLNRNATETRVHGLWNHLIETASSKTGSMLLWDTGEYEVLPDKPSYTPETDSDEDASSVDGEAEGDGLTESEKLRRAFQNSKMHLRLHGTRLPRNYTIFLNRDKSDLRSAPTAESLAQIPRKRKRRRITKSAPSSTSESEPDTPVSNTESSSGKRKQPEPEHSDAEGAANDFQIRLNNAYPGAVNDIGSIHQRRWFIMLDRSGSGFISQKDPDNEGKKRWVRGIDNRSGNPTGFDPFYVRGPEVERSVLTGRLGVNILKDEGVEDFMPRRGWKPVLL